MRESLLWLSCDTGRIRKQVSTTLAQQQRVLPALICVVYQPTLWLSGLWLGLLLFFPAVASLVWLVDFGQRDQMRRTIEATLRRKSK